MKKIRNIIAISLFGALMVGCNSNSSNIQSTQGKTTTSSAVIAISPEATREPEEATSTPEPSATNTLESTQTPTPEPTTTTQSSDTSSAVNDTHNTSDIQQASSEHSVANPASIIRATSIPVNRAAVVETPPPNFEEETKDLPTLTDIIGRPIGQEWHKYKGMNQMLIQ